MSINHYVTFGENINEIDHNITKQSELIIPVTVIVNASPVTSITREGQGQLDAGSRSSSVHGAVGMHDVGRDDLNRDLSHLCRDDGCAAALETIVTLPG